MALAPFFDKAALGAAALMQGVSPEKFASMMSPLAVTLRFGADATDSLEGRTILDLATNLLARLYPFLGFETNCSVSGAYARQLKDQARAINPKIEFVSPSAPFIAVGQTVPLREGFCAYVGSNGWIAHFSTTSPRPLCNSNNPIGAGAAACFGAAAIFRHYFHGYMGVAVPNEEFDLSLFTYRRSLDHDKACSTDFEIGEVALAGVGAIGNAVIWTLSRSGCRGRIALIDPETIDKTNPQRYVLTTSDSVGKAKTAIAKEHLASSMLTAEEHRTTWGGFAAQRGWRVGAVAVALDSGADRIAVQASLPQVILNAWTQANDLGVSRHAFLSDSACLACLYWPNKQSPNEDELVKQAIKYDGNLIDIRNMLYFRTPLDDAFIDRIAKTMGVEKDRIAVFKGKPLDVFYREGICGGQILTAVDAKIEVPMGFQSALAGIMLAAEVIKSAANGHRLDTSEIITKIDMLRPLGRRLSEPYRKRRDVKCICLDGIYIERFKEKYRIPGAPIPEPRLK